MFGYDQDNATALEAISWAQTICFAPMLFKSTVLLKRLGVLAALKEAQRTTKQGLTVAQLAEQLALSPYALGVLLDMGLSGRIVMEDETGRFRLTKAGQFLLDDPMCAINLDFTEDVCYQALDQLEASLKHERAEGLRVFGFDDGIIYPHLSQLPEPAKTTWFAYDHFYSDAAFAPALKQVLSLQPKRIFDVGGNTGRFARTCVERDPDVAVTILDLPEQIALAQAQLKSLPQAERISFHPVNVLEDTPFPAGADVWWLSQFLDCFGADDIVAILRRVHAALPDDGTLCILELFPDAQRFEAAALALNATSLYFTVLANGKSRFYRSTEFLQLVERAGFKLTSRTDNIGLGHTLLMLKKA